MNATSPFPDRMRHGWRIRAPRDGFTACLEMGWPYSRRGSRGHTRKKPGRAGRMHRHQMMASDSTARRKNLGDLFRRLQKGRRIESRQDRVDSRVVEDGYSTGVVRKAPAAFLPIHGFVRGDTRMRAPGQTSSGRCRYPGRRRKHPFRYPCSGKPTQRQSAGSHRSGRPAYPVHSR